MILKYQANAPCKRPVGGHDSCEDALACLDLMKMKAKEDVKRLKQMARVEARKK